MHILVSTCGCGADLVDFSSVTARHSPLQIVHLLNEVYTLFDSAIDRFDVYKVHTHTRPRLLRATPHFSHPIPLAHAITLVFTHTHTHTHLSYTPLNDHTMTVITSRQSFTSTD